MTSQRTHRRTGGLVGAATVLAVAVLTGCSTTTDDARTSGDEAGQASDHRLDRNRAGTAAKTPVPDPREPSNGPAEESNMQIEIRVGDERFTAAVDDTPAGRDLLAQLPQTIQMHDHRGVEKTGPLRASLSLDRRPAGADPAVGDLGYYAPGNDLVLYYGDQSYYNGIVILGALDSNATSRLAEFPGDITAHVSVLHS